jgi:hypothetical protein
MSFHKIFSPLDPSAPRKTHAMAPGITEVESVFREYATGRECAEWGSSLVCPRSVSPPSGQSVCGPRSPPPDAVLINPFLQTSTRCVNSLLNFGRAVVARRLRRRWTRLVEALGPLAHLHYRCGVVLAMPSRRSMRSSRRRCVVFAGSYTSAWCGLLTRHPVVRARQVCGESCCIYRWASISPSGPISQSSALLP